VMVAGGVGLGAFQVWWETALAERIPPHLLSRVSAWDWMGSLALLPLGYAFTGPLADAVGARWVMAVGGVIGTAATAAALLPHSTRSLRRSESAPLTLVRPA
jgi:MFS family permease